VRRSANNLGIRAKVAILCLLGCLVNGTSLHAEDHRNASARLQIQVMVMPTLIALDSTHPQAAHPAQGSVNYNFRSDDQRPATYSVRNLPMANNMSQSQSTAVLKTMTIVAD